MDIYNDSFMEYLIKKKKSKKDYIIIALVIFAAVLFSILMLGISVWGAIASKTYGTGMSVGLVIIALGWYGAYLLITMHTGVEYEYILTNSEMDIDKIMSKRGRKHLVSWDFKNIDICACVNDVNYSNEYKSSVSIEKTYDLTGESTTGRNYFVDYTDENGVKTRVLFTPTSKIIEKAKKYNMRKVFIME